MPMLYAVIRALEEDLVDVAKPGDRIRVMGMLKCFPRQQNGGTHGFFPHRLICNNMEILSKSAQLDTDSGVQSPYAVCQEPSEPTGLFSGLCHLARELSVLCRLLPN